MQAQFRPYQQRVITKTTASIMSQLENVEKRYASSLISSPAGSGKTFMGLTTIKNVLQQLGNEDLIVGWSAMRHKLLTQAERENEKFTQIKNFVPISIFDNNPPQCDILMFDEAQHSAADSAVNLLGAVKPKIYLGLSATPFRLDRVKLNFSETIIDANYRGLIKDGWLSKFNMYIMGDEYDVENVTARYLQFKEQWGKSIAYFLTTEECERAAAIVRAAGVRASVVTHLSDVDEEIRKFETGETDILFNVYMLVEGFDCPELKTVFVRDSNMGTTIQMAGRCLRLFDGKIANMVQSTRSKHPFTKFADPVDTYTFINNQWESANMKHKLIEKSIKDASTEVNKHKHKSSPGLLHLMNKDKNRTNYAKMMRDLPPPVDHTIIDLDETKEKEAA